MPTTLSKGYKLPLTGERDWYTTLEDNITRLNSHSHNGTDSERVQAKNVVKSYDSLDSTDWVAVAGHTGLYSQTVTVPSGIIVDEMIVKFYISTGLQAGYVVLPSIRKLTSTTYEVFTNDNTVGWTLIYG